MAEKVKFDKCCIRKCKYLPQSIKLFGMELCFKHQSVIDEWLYDRGYEKTTVNNYTVKSTQTLAPQKKKGSE